VLEEPNHPTTIAKQRETIQPNEWNRTEWFIREPQQLNNASQIEKLQRRGAIASIIPIVHSLG
jgi:hypothetical protein